MRDITSLEERMRCLQTFEFPDGTRFTCDDRFVREHGVAGVMKFIDPEYDPGPPLPVYQRGKMVGTLSPLWSAWGARRTLMYEPRQNDFVREGDKWIADPMLGPGDLLHAGVNMIDKPEW